MSVNPDISDLFFNFDTDVDITIKDGEGNFDGYDEEKLRERAITFLGYLHRLGVDTPSVFDLIADFHARI